jgi:hypothetical protein
LAFVVALLHLVATTECHWSCDGLAAYGWFLTTLVWLALLTSKALGARGGWHCTLTFPA